MNFKDMNMGHVIDLLISLALIVAVGASALLSGGCTSDTQLARAHAASDTVAKFQADVARLQKPTFSGECTAGCTFAYNDPRDRVQVTGQHVMGNNEAMVKLAPEIKSVLSYGILGYTAQKIVRGSNSGDGNVTNNTSNNVNSDGDVNITNDVGVSGPVQNVSDVSSLEETVVENSNNSYDSNDAVSDPFVVEQPPYNDPIVISVPAAP